MGEGVFMRTLLSKWYLNVWVSLGRQIFGVLRPPLLFKATCDQKSLELSSLAALPPHPQCCGIPTAFRLASIVEAVDWALRKALKPFLHSSVTL